MSTIRPTTNGYSAPLQEGPNNQQTSTSKSLAQRIKDFIVEFFKPAQPVSQGFILERDYGFVRRDHQTTPMNTTNQEHTSQSITSRIFNRSAGVSKYQDATTDPAYRSDPTDVTTTKAARKMDWDS